MIKINNASSTKTSNKYKPFPPKTYPFIFPTNYSTNYQPINSAPLVDHNIWLLAPSSSKNLSTDSPKSSTYLVFNPLVLKNKENSN